MKLDYSQFDNAVISDTADGVSKLEENTTARQKYVISEIQNRVSKINKKKEEIANLTYEKDLILNNIVDVIHEDLSGSRNNLLCCVNGAELCRQAWEYYRTKANKKKVADLTEEEKVYKVSYDYIISLIKKNFFMNKKGFSLSEINMYAYGMAYWFTFKYNKMKINIAIPIFSEATVDNYQFFLTGYSITYEAKSNIWFPISSGFDFDRIAADVETWVNNVDQGVINLC